MNHIPGFSDPVDTGLDCPVLFEYGAAVSGSCSTINVKVQWLHEFKWGVIIGAGPWDFFDLFDLYYDVNVVAEREFKFRYCCCCNNPAKVVESLEILVAAGDQAGWLSTHRPAQFDSAQLK